MNEMIDMSRFTEAKSDQLNADDLIGISKTITVTRVTGSDGDQPISIYYQGDNGKPFKPCKTIRRVLMAVWGRYANEYVGRSMTIYRDDKVTFGGLETGGIRISHMSHIDKKTVVVVLKSKGKKAGVEIHPLVDAPPTESQKQRQTPEQWLDGYLAEIARVPTLDALEATKQRAAKPLAKLKTDQPALYDRAGEAADARANALNPATGRTDEQHGDQFDGTDDPFGLPPVVTLASAHVEIAACTTEADVNTRVAALMPLFDDADAAELRGHGLERISVLRGEG